MARWYGRGETMSLLANAGIDILVNINIPRLMLYMLLLKEGIIKWRLS